MLTVPVSVYPCVVGTGVGIARVKSLLRKLPRHLLGLDPHRGQVLIVKPEYEGSKFAFRAGKLFQNRLEFVL